MKKGGTLETVLFIGACVLVLITGFLVFTREENNSSQKMRTEQAFRESIVGIETSLRIVTGELDTVSKRVKLLEDKKEIDISIKNPIQVTILRPPHSRLPALPVAPHTHINTLNPHENN